MHERTCLPSTIEFPYASFGESHDAIDRGMQGPIPSEVRVSPRPEFRSFLTDDDIARMRTLSAEKLDAAPLRTAVADI